ncbi:SNF2 family N-terminal domain containing protein [Tritrichomonas foetus]|uniref:SNF2 family N-terminal domain containing protein n=1 Tax=Tritrichomonas foetus TaxID=1144522 RepID=A0A1J4L024_9EUKA|nr:SNF2 family N-terminal domain containing protein [Tritrichomonas foetus]|eukprot:OHT16762.1 SNF2 family N-terminal domain containing protein [Tritrichomonas foetus]
MKRKKQTRPKKAVVYTDSSSSEMEEEEVPDDFGDTSTSSNSSSDNSDLEDKEQGDNVDESNENFPIDVQQKPQKEIPLIQEILGVKETDDSNDYSENESSDNRLYYVKWTGKSYIHCKYLPKSEIESISGGSVALRKYQNKVKRNGLSQSLSIPSLMTLDSFEVSANWYEVDRIIGDTLMYDDNNSNEYHPENINDNSHSINNENIHEDFNENENQNENENEIQKNEKGEMKQKYYVKWKGQGYEECTWELKEDIPDNYAIQKYEARKNLFNSTKISDNKRNVDPKSFEKLSDPLSDKEGNTLRDYQVDGFNWLRFCWYNGNNSILADEMGLGKTLQVVSALHDIYINHNIHGPFLVIAPLSTLPHWKNEFERWTKMNAIIYHGISNAKEIIQHYEMFEYDENGNRDMSKVKFDIVITNYETFMSDFDMFNSIEWHYLVLDEGHRLKNHTGKCYNLLKQITYEHCTLLTGTPVQNNVEELWSLLHFLHPDRFRDLSSFMERFGVIEDAEKIKQLQDVIKPYILRRKKSDVDTSIAEKEETIIEVELTRAQKTYYRALVSDNASTLLQQITGGALPSLLNLMMQLRKVCNHPFLLKGAEQQIEEQTAQKLNKPKTDEEVMLRSIVDSSGKLILIDKLLPKLREGGHKVLIFSQMVKVLDILEDYLRLIDIKPERIDGSVPENERQNAIERFATDPNAFVFLLCTRAGGVGINLTAADTVIIFDSDWNPQNDIQAESRCHRIGQKSKVKVYRLVTRGTYEFEMLNRASKKLGLDHAILDGGDINNKQNPMAANEIEKLLRSGFYNITDDDEEIDKFCSADIDQILDSRSMSFKREITGTDSKFSKAAFVAEQDHLDIDSKDFWATVLPQIQTVKNDVLPERKCKQKPLKFNDNDGDDSNSKKRRRNYVGNPTPRGVAAKIMHDGYKGSSIEKALILYAANEETLAPEDVEILKRILGVDSLTEKSDEVLKAEKRFSPSLEEFTDKKVTLLKRTFFFYQLNQVMTYIQGPIENWPKTESCASPLADYALMYGILTNGLGQQNRVMEGITFDAVLPQLSDKMIQRIGHTIIMSFINDAGTIEHFPKKYSEPNVWREEHSELFNRKNLTNEEFQTLFQTLTLTGFVEKGETPKVNYFKYVKPDENSSEAKTDENQANDQTEDQSQNQPLNQCQSEIKKETENIETKKEIKIENVKIENKDENTTDQNVENESSNTEDNIDWDLIRRYSGLDCVSVDAIAEQGTILLKLSRDDLEKDEQESVCERLGTFGNKSWISRMKSTIRDIHKIRNFMRRITDADREKAEKMRQWDSAPAWWGSEHDLALIQAIADFGLIYVTLILSDPDRPFFKYIVETSYEDFTKASEAEIVKSRPQKPRDAGEFSFLYNDKSRLLRANVVIQYIDSQIEKRRRFETIENNVSDEAPIELNTITELPSLPLELSPQVTLLDLGTFLSSTDSYPVGYRVSRSYFSLKNPLDKTWYEAWTKVNDEGMFRYVVKHMSDPVTEFEAHTSSGVWEDVIREIQNVRGKLGMTKRKFTSVSGPFMYGFSTQMVTNCFKLMKKQAEEEGK